VVIHQHSRKLLMMDILMSETCWCYKKWNKIASDIKLVFCSSTITMMHGPINIIFHLVTYLKYSKTRTYTHFHWMGSVLQWRNGCSQLVTQCCNSNLNESSWVK
jgi:hypothetical protein